MVDLVAWYAGSVVGVLTIVTSIWIFMISFSGEMPTIRGVVFSLALVFLWPLAPFVAYVAGAMAGKWINLNFGIPPSLLFEAVESGDVDVGYEIPGEDGGEGVGSETDDP